MAVYKYRKGKYRILLFLGTVKQIGIYFRINPPYFNERTKYGIEVSLWFIKFDLQVFRN